MRTRFSVAVRAGGVLLLLAASTAAPTAASTPVAYGVPSGGGSPAVSAAPGADLGVRIDGATIRSSADRKVVTVTVANKGPGTARGVVLRLDGWVDSEVLNPASVDFCPSAGGPEAAPGPSAVPSLQVPVTGRCPLAELPAGRSVDLRATLGGPVNAIGTVGRLTLTVSQSGADPVPADNSATAPLTFLGASGDELYARAWDAPADGSGRAGVVFPGRTAELRFEVGNRGTGWVGGMTVTVRLPAYVRFAGTRPGCGYDAARRTATCTYGDLPVLPAIDDVDPADGNHSALRFRHALEVSAAAPAPAELTGGQVSVAPIETGYLPDGEVAELPRGVTGLRARDLRDVADNDRFAVRTGLPAGDRAGPPAGDRAGPPAGDGAGLPVTGAPARLAVVAGAGLVTTGLALLLLARRRGPGLRRRAG